jgi:Cupredoxin-like domain
MSVKSIVKALPIVASFAFLGLGFLAVSCSGGGASSGSSSSGGGTSGTATSASSSPQAAVVLHYTVSGSDDGAVGPDGKKHDTFVATDLKPIQAGQPVTISIKNTDEMPHSLTSPDLKLNIMIPGAKNGKAATVNFTFTPSKAGTYRWWCAVPCDTDNNAWAMTSSSSGPGQDGFMAGTITVQ